MVPDLVAWLLKVLAMAGPYNDKLKASWPHVQTIGNECEAILVIWNDGKMELVKGKHQVPLTPRGKLAVENAISAGIPAAEAQRTVALLEAASLHIPEEPVAKPAVESAPDPRQQKRKVQNGGT